MIIHVVQPGETINTIAQSYEKSVTRLIQENGLPNPDKLVVGQTIVIVYPKETYIVKKGDTLAGIADAHGITLKQLLRNNPYLSYSEFFYIGDELVISYVDNKIMKISTNGYVFPFIDKDIFKRTLPYLTYLTIYSYSITAEGDLIDINDTELIQMAKVYGVAPIMLISTLTEKGVDQLEISTNIFNNQEKQNRLIDNVLTTLKTKGYYGLNIDIPYILKKDKQLYEDFIINITNRLKKEGFEASVTLSPNIYDLETGIVEQIDYARLNQPVNVTMLLSYEWGYSFGYPMGVIPFDNQKKLIDYSVTKIPADMIYIGVSSIGYMWQLPYVEGVTRALSVSNTTAIDLASQYGVAIQYSDTSQAPFFTYEETSDYIVWFKDARSFDAILKLISEYGLKGIGIWNIMNLYPQMWLEINSQYEIETVL